MIRTLNVFKHLVCVSALSLSATVGCAAAPLNPQPIPISNAPQLAPVPATSHTAHRSVAKAPPKAGMHSVTKKETAALKNLNDRYRTARSVTMDVSKHVKLGLIGSERKSTGKLFLAKGQLRMELDGSEKTLLVVNKKNLFAVTYPDSQLKGAALQIIKGETTSKKAQSQALTGLLGAGGFLKSFKPTALQVSDDGEQTYYLQPTNNQSEFIRAQLRVSADGKEIKELHYWDARDNETTYGFSNSKFGAKLDPELFNYNPPADADIMNL